MYNFGYCNHNILIWFRAVYLFELLI
jgi:hypothetical protein